jgi:hypothetical protein
VLDDGAARKRFAAGSDLRICACSKGYFCADVSGSVRVYWLLFFSIPILRRKVSERLHWILFQLKFIWLSRSRGSEVRDTAHAVLTRVNVAIVRCIPSHVVLYPICRLGIADSRQTPNLKDRNRRQNQSKVPALFAAIICAFSINVQADDGKIISSAICQAMTPNGAEHLRHLGLSLQAVEADVTVLCPIVRDSMGGRMKWVDVRHRRPTGAGGESPKLIDRKTCRPTIRSALGRSLLAGDRRDGLGLSVARKRAPTDPGAAMSSLPTAPSSSIERRAHQPCARPWVGARLRATVAMASGSPSPASGLLLIPARQCHLCRQPQAHRAKNVHTNPYARPWVGARLRATVAMASGSPSPASGLLPVPARQCHLCRQPRAHRSKDVHTNPYARPWVGARLRATVAMASGSPSPASGLLPVPARQCHLC